MSDTTVQIDGCAEEVIDRLRKLLAFGPVVTPEAVYDAGILMSVIGARFEGLSKQMMKDQKHKVIMQDFEAAREKYTTSRPELALEAP